MRVWIETGHGLNNTTAGIYDPGAASRFGQEHEIVTRIAGGVLAALAAEDVREIPDAFSLFDTIRIINEKALSGDILISLHMNAGPEAATGTEVYYAAVAPHARRLQAHALGNAVANALLIPFRGAKPDTSSQHSSGLAILRRTRCAALLLEIAFITNKGDVAAVRERGVPAVTGGVRVLRGAERWADLSRGGRS